MLTPSSRYANLSFEVNFFNYRPFLKFQLVSLLLVNMLMSDIRYGLNNVISSADGEKLIQFSATGKIPTRSSLVSQLADKAAVGSTQERSKVAIFHKIVLTRNPPEVPVTS